jgi:ligand-binding sensor domain-containing protein
VAADGTLWFGTWGGGVSRFDGQTWTAFTTPVDGTGADGLISNEVWSVAVAPDGALWFGTACGVSRYVEDTQTWSAWTNKEGLAHDKVYVVALAPDGTPYLGTENGVSRLTGAGANHTWETIRGADGLADDRVRTIAVAPDGALWFGTWHGGVSRYLPPNQ